ncbi:hypothetical protein RJ639_044633 [Escallonia herrerae]|uniref:Protein odr-4 homolog n=1 Tax=Escallonia herrerae TaxID=1293975 RepID=A0AA89B2L3_9ASTE|nr:hypothetical protein RJ639_044633 [Escallonia herrerae]
MVKAVVGEETQLKLAEDRLAQCGASSQVGLVIGKLSAKLDRGFVFDLVPTPPNDDGQPACSVTEGDKKRAPNKGKSQAEPLSLLFVDTDWVAEHARQIGDKKRLEKLEHISYVKEPTRKLVRWEKVSRLLLGGMKVVGIYIWVNESTFKNSTIALCQTVKGVAEAAPLLEVGLDERLLIHISYSPRSENASSTRRLVDILRRGISSHAKELKDAKALIDGMLFCVIDPDADNYVGAKGDIITSLMSRLDIICDEAERELDTISTGGVEASYDISTAKPILQHDLQLLRCETTTKKMPNLSAVRYKLQESDEKFVLKDHCVELMSMEAPTDASTILEPETEATTLVVGKSFWDMAVPFSSESTLPKGRDERSLVGDKNTLKSTDFNITAALLILVLSIVLGLVLLVWAS